MNLLEIPLAAAEAQPFLKWVGGKSQLLAQFDRFFPREIERYVEPFIGGGCGVFSSQGAVSEDAGVVARRQRRTHQLFIRLCAIM
jgi:hypothetical protein